MSVFKRFGWQSRLAGAGVLTVALMLLFPTLAFANVTLTQISSDPFTQATCKANNTTNHHTEVEPDTFSNGSTIVAAFQVGRIFDGGACAIGFATSTNNGATWTSGLLPGITKWSGGGANDRATDAAVAYDAKHNVWLISSLTLREAGGVHGNAVVTSRSTDGGLTWGNPVTTATGGDLDKNWIVCDNTSTSPFYGNCYTEWDNHGAGNLLQMSRSPDGGQTWSAAATNNTGVIGGQPVVRPDGTVIVPIDNANETAIGAFHSTNGGVDLECDDDHRDHPSSHGRGQPARGSAAQRGDRRRRHGLCRLGGLSLPHLVPLATTSCTASQPIPWGRPGRR